MVARAMPSVPYLGSLNLANNRMGVKTLTEFSAALAPNKYVYSVLTLSRRDPIGDLGEDLNFENSI